MQDHSIDVDGFALIQDQRTLAFRINYGYDTWDQFNNVTLFFDRHGEITHTSAQGVGCLLNCTVEERAQQVSHVYSSLLTGEHFIRRRICWQ
jgi:hypothetical protein